MVLIAIAGADGTPLQEGVEIHLCTAGEAAEILGAVEGYIEHLGPVEIAARMATREGPGPADFAAFAARQALPFTPAERARLRLIIASISRRLSEADITPPFPTLISIAKTTGLEEGGAAYCKGPAIIFPRKFMLQRRGVLERIVIHELFHIMTAANPELQSELYGIFGFHPCNEIELPPAIAARRYTNPDAYRRDHYTEVEVGGETLFVVPVLLIDRDLWESSSYERLFELMRPMLLVIENDGRWRPALDRDGKPRLLHLGEAPQYLFRLGANTGYTIDQEEACADNFVIIVKGEIPVSPEEPARMRKIIESTRAGAHAEAAP